MPARVRAIRARCTCKKRLGRHQSTFEVLLKSGLSVQEALEILDIKKMCCMSNMIYPSTYVVGDANASRIVDEVNKEEGGLITVVTGPELILENVPDFPF